MMKQWKFITAEEYKSNKDSLPSVCFATRHTIDELADRLRFLKAGVLHNDFEFNLSTRDPEKSVGSDEIWGKATEALREALDRHGVEYKIKDGDAAFFCGFSNAGIDDGLFGGHAFFMGFAH